MTTSATCIIAHLNLENELGTEAHRAYGRESATITARGRRQRNTRRHGWPN